jgi:hypothetical protein
MNAEATRRAKSVAVDFIELAGLYLHGLDNTVAPRTVLRRFVSHFGISPFHCAVLWLISADNLIARDPYVKPLHLLWTLNLLKTDATENQLAGRWHVDEKTLRKWVYIVLEEVSNLGLVSAKTCCILIKTTTPLL